MHPRAGLYAFICLILTTKSLHSQVTRYAVSNGNWNQTSTWSASSGGASGASIPVAGDIVYIGEVAPGMSVIIPAAYTAACATLNLGSATNGASNLSLASANSGLNVSANAIINRPSAANSNSLNVNDGIVNIGGSLTLAGSATNANRINKVVINNGVLSISIDLILITGNNASNLIDMNGGSGILNLGGAFTGTNGTLTSGTGSKIIYNKAGNQTVNSSLGSYNKLVLAGSGAKTITGITINDTLFMQGTATTTGSTPAFGSGSTLVYEGTASQTTGNEFRTPFPGAGGVMINNSNGVVLAANRTVTYSLRMQLGTLDMNAHTLTAGDLQGTGSITTNAAGTATLTVGSDDLDMVYIGQLINGAGTLSLTKNGEGTLTLSGNSNYAGITTISEGTIRIAAAGNGTNSPLGTTAGATTITNGAVLDLNGISLSTAEGLTIRGTGISNGGSLVNSSSTAVTYNGLLTLAANSSIVADAGEINLSNTGSITGSGYNLTIGGIGNGILSGILATGSGRLIKSGAGTWVVSGNNSYTGTTTISGGIFKVGASASVLGTTGNNTTVSSGGVLDLNGYTITTAEQLTINGTGTSGEGAVINSSSTDVEYSGLLRMGSSSTIRIDNGAINFLATGTITGGGTELTLAGSGNGILASIIGTGGGSVVKDGTGTWLLSGVNTYNGPTTINAGTFKIGNAGGVIPNNSTVTLDGTLDLNGNDESVGLISGTGIITSSASGNLTFSAGNATNTNFSVSIQDGSATLNFTKNGNGTMTLGAISTYSGLTTIAAGTIKLGITGNSTNSSFGNSTSGISITSGASLDLNGYSIPGNEGLVLRGTGVSSGGALMNSSATASIFQGLLSLAATSSIIAGTGAINITNTGTITGSGFSLTLNGSANGSIGGSLNIGTGTLTKNGTGIWTLAGGSNAVNSLTLTSGKLAIAPGAVLTITSGSAISGSGFGSTKHVITEVNTSTGAKGVLRISGFSGSMTFPVGNGGYYLPLVVNASGSNDFGVTAFQGATENGQPNGTPFSSIAKLMMIDANWIVQRNTGSSSTTIQASWPAALEGTTFQGFPDSEIGLSRYTGAVWDDASGSGSQSSNNATRNALVAFGAFGSGKVGIPLSLNFRTLRVAEIEKGLKVDWSVLNESDISHYEIQRSSDGRLFNTIGEVGANGNPLSESNYSFIDFPVGSYAYYYRIVAVEKNGKLIYSTIVRIEFHSTEAGMSIYPNPVQHGNLSFHAADLSKGEYKIRIYNSTGQQLLQIPLHHTGGAISQLINLPGNVPAGLYVLKLERESVRISNFTFIVR